MPVAISKDLVRTFKRLNIPKFKSDDKAKPTKACFEIKTNRKTTRKKR